jgi:hypothetical protein
LYAFITAAIYCKATNPTQINPLTKITDEKKLYLFTWLIYSYIYDPEGLDNFKKESDRLYAGGPETNS